MADVVEQFFNRKSVIIGDFFEGIEDGHGTTHTRHFILKKKWQDPGIPVEKIGHGHLRRDIFWKRFFIHFIVTKLSFN